MRSVVIDQRPPPQRRWTPRLVATLALFAISATLFCAAAALVLVRQADERQGLQRRAALLGAIEDVRASGADIRALDRRQIERMERVAGLDDLRFEAEPAGDGREMQSVLNHHGRIIGWFSWRPNLSMSNALGAVQPLLAVAAVFVVGFAGVTLWQVRRAVHGLAKSERLAWRLAHEDMLTGLPNHRKMIERIDAVLDARQPDEVVTLGLLDLDRLNEINDALGHQAGDDLLAALANRMLGLLPPHAVCGRFDGDEFAVLTIGSEAGSAEMILAQLAEQLRRPFWLTDQVVEVGITVGLAHVPNDAGSRDELIRSADLALRAAKRSARGGARHFEPAMEAEFEERHFLERELRRALDAEMLDVHYQPVVSADGNRIVGVEALARWSHPERGMIAPADFIPVAERCGLMPRLGGFVLRRALADAARWPDLPVAVNLSPVQVRDVALVSTIARLLAEYGVPPQRLTLEITEGVLIDNPAESKRRLDALKALGVHLALDDFGTGYSSLTYLQRFAFDTLKIDKGFVEPLGTSAKSRAMVQAIVALGRALGMTLLAEGVETEEQRVLLRLAGCQRMQGFLFGPAVSCGALERLLAEVRAVA